MLLNLSKICVRVLWIQEPIYGIGIEACDILHFCSNIGIFFLWSTFGIFFFGQPLLRTYLIRESQWKMFQCQSEYVKSINGGNPVCMWNKIVFSYM